MPGQTKTLAFFGATGGCVNAALVLALQAGHACTALARTPSKLRDMLLAKGVAAATLDAHLRIVQGDARDERALRAVLAPPAGAGAVTTAPADGAYAYDHARAVQQVVSGMGAIPWSTAPDWAICADFATTLVAALRSLQLPAGAAPFLSAVSTTGITAGPRDVPLALVPLYHVALAKPHVDKRAMEAAFTDAAQEGLLRGVCCVRPTLLTSGAEHERARVRVGSVEQPELGYMVSRMDVGRWIHEELVQGDEMTWAGTKPTLTA